MKLKKLTAAIAVTILSTLTNVTAFAAKSSGSSQTNDIQNSKLFTGTMTLLSDVCTAITALSLITGTLAIIYFLVRRQNADEQDKKEWQKRAIGAVACTILIPLVSATLGVITGYYS